MTRRERLKKLLGRRKQKDRITVITFEPFGDGPHRPIVFGGTPAQRDAILTKWDAEHPSSPPQAPGHWSKAYEASPGTAPEGTPAIQQPPGAPAGHDELIVDSGAHPGAPASSTQLTCGCGAVVEASAGGPVTCRSCGTAFRG